MILPSILSASHLRLYENLAPLAGVAPFLHIDLEDGVFVPNLSFGPKVIEEIYRTFGFSLDVHYMVQDPQRYIDIFSSIPQKWVSYHYETGIAPSELSLPEGARVGLAVNPDTRRIPDKLLATLDFVVVMGVYPGFGGAPFEEVTYDNVAWYDRRRTTHEHTYDIIVDGAVSRDNILGLLQQGANHFVVGSGIFRHDPLKAYTELTTLCDNYDGHKRT
jgi:ribulose-phosphate 3-epimerase